MPNLSVSINFLRTKSLMFNRERNRPYLLKRSYSFQSKFYSKNGTGITRTRDNVHHRRRSTLGAPIKQMVVQRPRSRSSECIEASRFHKNYNRTGLKSRSLKKSKKDVKEEDSTIDLELSGNKSYDNRQKDAFCSAQLQPDSSQAEGAICYRNPFLYRSIPEINDDSEERVPVSDALWLVLTLMSVWGLTLFTFTEKSAKVSRVKMLIAVIQLSGVLAALAYTIYFFIVESLPTWFIIYTLPYSFTHIFAASQYITILIKHKGVVGYMAQLFSLRVKYTSKYHVYPIVMFLYSLFSLIMLFVVMPDETYGITLALMTSLFLPTVVDVYITGMIWIFMDGSNVIKDKIIQTKIWSRKRITMVSYDLKYFHEFIQNYNIVSADTEYQI